MNDLNLERNTKIQSKITQGTAIKRCKHAKTWQSTTKQISKRSKTGQLTLGGLTVASADDAFVGEVCNCVCAAIEDVFFIVGTAATAAAATVCCPCCCCCCANCIWFSCVTNCCINAGCTLQLLEIRKILAHKTDFDFLFLMISTFKNQWKIWKKGAPSKNPLRWSENKMNINYRKKA